MKMPEDCNNIYEIRNEIDQIDIKLISLLGQRFKLVKEIVKYKTDEKSIIAQERYNTVLKQRRIWAEEKGLNPDIIEDMYKMLIKHFISEEMEILNNNTPVNTE